MPRPHEEDLRAIDGFIELIEMVARNPVQKSRVLDVAHTKLSGAGLNALRIIARSGPIPVTEVARLLGVDQSTASRQIKPVEDAGLVARTSDEADRRVAWLAITREGSALLDRIHQMRRDDLDHVLAGWSDRERAQLARTLERFKQAMLDATARRPVG